MAPVLDNFLNKLNLLLTSAPASTDLTIQSTAQDTDWAIRPAGELLAMPHRADALRQIKSLTSVPERHWLSLYVPMLNSYAQLVQELPASEVHHHSHRGGMLDHTIEVVMNGLKLRRGYVLPVGAVPERISALGELYTYAVATSCLLHDVGKIVCDQYIEVITKNSSRRWFPWEGPMNGSSYRMRFVRGRKYALHEPIALLLGSFVVPAKGLTWLASEPEVWELWIEAIKGGDTGVLSEIVGKADSASVARNLGANTGKAAAMAGAPKPLQQKILTALKYLLSDGKLAVNRRGAAGWLTESGLWLVSKTTADAIRAQLIAEGHDGIPSQNPRLFEIMQDHNLLIPYSGERAIWNCKVNDGQGWEHELTLLRIDPATIWSPDAIPEKWSGNITPIGNSNTGDAANVEVKQESNNSLIDSITNSLLGELQPTTKDKNLEVDEPQIKTSNLAITESEKPAPATSEESEAIAKTFVEWLKSGLNNGKIKINEADAPCHIVSDGLFLVTPGIFKNFVEAHPQYLVIPSAPPRDQVELLEVVRSLKTSASGQNSVGQESWQPIQRAFQKLKLHKKHEIRGENIWRCTVQGGRKRSEIKGFFVAEPSAFIDKSKIKNNKYLTLLQG